MTAEKKSFNKKFTMSEVYGQLDNILGLSFHLIDSPNEDLTQLEPEKISSLNSIIEADWEDGELDQDFHDLEKQLKTMVLILKKLEHNPMIDQDQLKSKSNRVNESLNELNQLVTDHSDSLENLNVEEKNPQAASFDESPIMSDASYQKETSREQIQKNEAEANEVDSETSAENLTDLASLRDEEETEEVNFDKNEQDLDESASDSEDEEQDEVPLTRKNRVKKPETVSENTQPIISNLNEASDLPDTNLDKGISSDAQENVSPNYDEIIPTPTIDTDKKFKPLLDALEFIRSNSDWRKELIQNKDEYKNIIKTIKWASHDLYKHEVDHAKKRIQSRLDMEKLSLLTAEKLGMFKSELMYLKMQYEIAESYERGRLKPKAANLSAKPAQASAQSMYVSGLSKHIQNFESKIQKIENAQRRLEQNASEHKVTYQGIVSDALKNSVGEGHADIQLLIAKARNKTADVTLSVELDHKGSSVTSHTKQAISVAKDWVVHTTFDKQQPKAEDNRYLLSNQEMTNGKHSSKLYSFNGQGMKIDPPDDWVKQSQGVFSSVRIPSYSTLVQMEEFIENYLRSDATLQSNSFLNHVSNNEWKGPALSISGNNLSHAQLEAIRLYCHDKNYPLEIHPNLRAQYPLDSINKKMNAYRTLKAKGEMNGSPQHKAIQVVEKELRTSSPEKIAQLNERVSSRRLS